MKYLISNKNNYYLNNKIKNNFKKITYEVKEYLKIENSYYFEVNFVSKYLIRKINREYRKKDVVTDVISFSYLNKDFNHFLLGEIFICYDQCIKQSKIYKKSLEREISFMFLHGLLHLLNYDHIHEEDRKIMFSIQDYILLKLRI